MREDRTERFGIKPREDDSYKKPQGAIGMDFPLEPPERVQPCPNCKLGLLASKIITKYIAVVLS